MPDPNKLDLLTTGQLAQYTSLSESFFEKLRSRGDGPTYLKIGGKVLYRRTDVDEWLESKIRKSRGGSNA